MKAEIYNALATINRGFDETIKSLTTLKTEGVLTLDYIQQQTEAAEELRANINYMILGELHGRESEDRDHWGTMRRVTEAKLKSPV